MKNNKLHLTERYKMLRYLLAIFAVLIVLTVLIYDELEAMSWPSETAALIRNFGWNDRGKPMLGMVFEGETDIFAAEQGEIIFMSTGSDTASRLPSPLGAWIAIDHGDGLISIYSRFEDSELFINKDSESTQVEKQQVIASAGISGWSDQSGFYFILYDRRERCWVNPSMIITPLKEARSPQILSVSLVNDQGVRLSGTQMRNVNQGRYSVLVTPASALGERDAFHALQRITCSVNGTGAGSLNFESVSARDGVLMVYRNGLIPVTQIYSNFPDYQAAEVFLNRGQIELEVVVQDIAGNSRSAVTRINVN